MLVELQSNLRPQEERRLFSKLLTLHASFLSYLSVRFTSAEKVISYSHLRASFAIHIACIMHVQLRITLLSIFFASLLSTDKCFVLRLTQSASSVIMASK